MRAQGDQGEVIASRLLLAIRKGSEKKLLLKAFKDVNLMRIETLLPNAKVKMKEFDKMLQMGTISVGAISLLIKVGRQYVVDGDILTRGFLVSFSCLVRRHSALPGH